MSPDRVSDVEVLPLPALRPYLYLDLGFYAACNLTCTYCRGELVRDDRSFSLEDLLSQVELFEARFQAGVVKLSGYGEITLWRGFHTALPILARRFPSVQVISNGTFGDPVRRALLAHENVFPNLTIDGHTIEMNRLRVGGDRRRHDQILANLEAIVGEGRPIEVNCVLHEHNAADLSAFCAYLEKLDAGRRLIVLFPFPVKPFDRAPERAAALRAGLSALGEMVPAIWERYGAILPPQVYGDQLREVLLRGQRTGLCHVHWANLGSGSRNERLHCANYGEALSFGPMAEALRDRTNTIAAVEEKNLARGAVGPNCTGCFNHFHILNHFLEGRLSLSELLRIPSLRPAGVRPIALAVQRLFVAERLKLGYPREEL